MNKLYLGDNLKIMQQMEDGSVDLIATDPPFYSQKDYGDFDDRWTSFNHYMDFMSDRIIEMYRLLKDNGSLCLHCDHSASHYLKIELDNIFGRKNFRNEIIWSYNRARPAGNQFARAHDIIFWYSKGKKWYFDKEYAQVPLSEGALKTKTIKFNDNRETWVRKRETKDMPDVWHIHFPTSSNERLGYSTQKPIKLYQRLIKACSDQNAIILDPFAGSGTTLDAAQSLGRKFIGIDQNPKSIEVIEQRLKENYGWTLEFEVIRNEK